MVIEMVVTSEAELEATVVPVTALEIKNPAIASTTAATNIAASRNLTLMKVSLTLSSTRESRRFERVQRSHLSCRRSSRVDLGMQLDALRATGGEMEPRIIGPEARNLDDHPLGEPARRDREDPATTFGSDLCVKAYIGLERPREPSGQMDNSASSDALFVDE